MVEDASPLHTCGDLLGVLGTAIVLGFSDAAPLIKPHAARGERPPAEWAGGSWAIVDSNHGPPPYQSGALTN